MTLKRYVPHLEALVRSHDFCVKSSSILSSGLGLFALEDLPSSTELCFFGPLTNEANEFTVEVGYGYSIEPTHCIGRFVNDGPRSGRSINAEILCCGMSASITLIKAVKSGEEIFVDYGSNYFKYFVSTVPIAERHHLVVSNPYESVTE